MAFPTIQFKATNGELDQKLTQLVEQKFTSLEKYVGEETDVLCEVEFEKETAHQSGNFFRIEANLTLKGKLYRAEARAESFEKAIDEVRSQLDKELRRASGRREALIKKGGRKLKEMLRFGR